MSTQAESMIAESVRRAHRRRSSRRTEPLSADAVHQAVDDAHEAVTLGLQTRMIQRRRHKSDRCGRLAFALAALARAQAPLRSELGRLPRSPRRDAAWGDDVRAASAEIIRERKKIRKMAQGCH